MCVGPQPELVAQMAEEGGEQVEHLHPARADLQLRFRARVAEVALERAQDRPARLARGRRGLRAEAQRSFGGGGDEGGYVVGVLEGDYGVVPAVHQRDHRVRRAEVDAEPHGLRLNHIFGSRDFLRLGLLRRRGSLLDGWSLLHDRTLLHRTTLLRCDWLRRRGSLLLRRLRLGRILRFPPLLPHARSLRKGSIRRRTARPASGTRRGSPRRSRGSADAPTSPARPAPGTRARAAARPSGRPPPSTRRSSCGTSTRPRTATRPQFRTDLRLAFPRTTPPRCAPTRAGTTRRRS